jgi:hypothetical protein
VPEVARSEPKTAPEAPTYPERIAAAESALNDAETALAAVALDHDLSKVDGDGLKAAEGRVVDATTALKRLQLAGDEADRRSAKALAEAEARQVRRLAGEFVAEQNAAAAGAVKFLDALESLVPIAAEAVAHGKEGARLGREIGIGNGRSTTLGVGFVRSALTAITDGIPAGYLNSRYMAARTGLTRPWRRGAVDERLTELGL